MFNFDKNLKNSRRYKNLVDNILITLVEDCKKEYLEVEDIKNIKHDFDYFCEKLSALDNNITKAKILTTGQVMLYDSIDKNTIISNHKIRNCILEYANQVSKSQDLYIDAMAMICITGACIYKYLEDLKETELKPDFEAEEKKY